MSPAPSPAPSPGRYADAFHGILGHPAPTRILGTALDSGRVPHAFLLAGPAGVGKTSVALKLAAALLCTGPDARPCGACADCGRLAHGNAFNLQTIVPDGAQIKVEQIRAMGEFMTTGPERGVVILSPAEAMRDQAANALLKTLEEPRAGWTLILVSSNQEGLLPTIRSRCQMVRFNRLSDADTARVLAQNGVSADHPENHPESHPADHHPLILRLAQGAPGGLMNMGMEPSALLDDYRAAVGVLDPEGLESPDRIISAAETWGADVETTRRFLTWAQVYVSEALHAAHGVPVESPGDDGSAARWAGHFRPRPLADFILRLEQVFDQLGRNINRQSAIEDLLVMLRSARVTRSP